MSFNTSAFLDAKLVPRTEDIKVPDLKPFFDKKDELVWKVRGLTGKELGRANEAVVRNKNIAAILDGLVSSQNSKKTDAVRKLIGNVENDTPEDIAKRLEMLVLGSVEPACDLDLALKLCTAFPVEFFQLTNAITTLTGKGQIGRASCRERV